ncbi:unnamed protein product [Calicophoron daubneyi]
MNLDEEFHSKALGGLAVCMTVRETFTFSSVMVKNVVFCEAKEIVAPRMIDASFDGIIGLGCRKAENELPLLLESLHEIGAIDHLIYSVFFKRNFSGGEFILGGINPDKYHGIMTFTEAADETEWKFYATGITLGMHTVRHDSFVALLNPGSHYLYGPKEDVDLIHASLGCDLLKTYCYVNCSTVEELPDLRIYVNDIQLVLRGEDYIRRLDNFSGPICMSTFVGKAKVQYWELGYPFLSSIYTVYDLEQNRIGLAQASTSAALASTRYLSELIPLESLFLVIYLFVFN